MAKWWIGGALVVWCIGSTAAHAQYLPPDAAPAPMPEPIPYAPGAPCAPAVEGPISPLAAPKGPSDCCDLPSDLPGAFQECNCPPPCGIGLWFGAEYIHWWTRNSRLPPLITTGSPNDPIPGAIGQPNTLIVFPAVGPAPGAAAVLGMGVFGANGESGEISDGKDRSGGRFSAGFWFNRRETIGVEGNYWLLADRTFDFGGGPFGGPLSPIVTRPVFLNTTNQETVSFIGLPFTGVGNFANGLIIGSFDVRLTNEFWGSEANFVGNILLLDHLRLDFLAGARYIQLQEKLSITTDTTNFGGVPGIAGTVEHQEDHFDTLNRYVGGQIGLRTEYLCNRLYANVTGKVAFGVNRERVSINGATIFQQPGGPLVTDMGGLLALPTNIGSFSRTEFAVVPELDVNVGYYIFGWMRVFAGYTLFSIGDVVRPGDQIDRVINPTQTNHLAGGPFTGQPRPLFMFSSTNYWAQGVSVGIEFRF